ncbi:hypothetical protein CSUI_006079 [Cystoisospora suis]|uniref:Uncharacterized protein n=1 Tax=Cystoisospora suis TaxID=483139 RepID=A0A2C6KHW5_9APIC|nr:hypothetical protein CSUI_006079 [Cystoisospora suis]
MRAMTVLFFIWAARSTALEPAGEVTDESAHTAPPATTEPANSPPTDYGQPHTVPESNYVPPVPRKEKPQRIFRHFYCCPEPHCCDVEKMVVKSQGEAEGELAKTVAAAATLGAEQAEYERKASEHRLSSADKDEEAAVSIVGAQEEAAVRLAEAVSRHLSTAVELGLAFRVAQKVKALDEELAHLQQTDQKIEKDEEAFNEKLVGRKEAEVTAAEDDLRELQTEKHKIADSIDTEVEQIEKEEKESDLDVKLSEAQEELLAAEDHAEEADLRKRIHELEREAQEAEAAGLRHKLREKMSSVQNEAKDAAVRGRAALQNAEEVREGIHIEHPNVGATEQAVMDTIRENEHEAEIEEHEAESEEEVASVTEAAEAETSGQDAKEDQETALLRRTTVPRRPAPTRVQQVRATSVSAKIFLLHSAG